MGILAKLFGLQPKTNYKELQEQGALIVDVRSSQEFAGGHIKNSINIPLENIQNNRSKIQKTKPVILCCVSGMRSGSAKRYLETQGYVAYNGGGWKALERKLNSSK